MKTLKFSNDSRASNYHITRRIIPTLENILTRWGPSNCAVYAIIEVDKWILQNNFTDKLKKLIKFHRKLENSHLHMSTKFEQKAHSYIGYCQDYI